MPSLLHESLVEMFRQHPLLAAELLEVARVLEPGSVVSGELADSDLTQVTPTVRQADAVVRLKGVRVLSSVVEVQLDIDLEKLWSWPAYLAMHRARERCDVVLLVITLDPATARWARQPIVLGPGSVIRPVVFGPSDMPVITDPAVAARSPEIAVLSTMAHGHEPEGLDVARAALEATAGLDESRARLYVDLILVSLPDAARRRLESLMIPNWQPQSELLKRLDAQALARGRKQGESALLLRLLERRFGEVPEDIRGRVEEATEAELMCWADEVLFADSFEALFGPRESAIR